MNNKIFMKIFVLLVLTIVFNANTEGTPKIDDCLEVVKKYQECIREAKWLDQSKLIIKEDLDAFKDKLISIPVFKGLEKMTGNELYAHIFGRMMINVKIDKLEIIDSIQESEELVHVVVRNTTSLQNVKKSKAKMLTLKYINNEWKISGTERLNKTSDRLHLQLLKSGMQKLRTQMLELQKLKTQFSEMQKVKRQKPETQKLEIQESEIQKQQ